MTIEYEKVCIQNSSKFSNSVFVEIGREGLVAYWPGLIDLVLCRDATGTHLSKQGTSVPVERLQSAWGPSYKVASTAKQLRFRGPDRHTQHRD